MWLFNEDTVKSDDKQEYLLLNFCSMLAKVSLLGELPGTEQGPESLAVCGHPSYIHSSLRRLTLREDQQFPKAGSPWHSRDPCAAEAGLPHS